MRATHSDEQTLLSLSRELVKTLYGAFYSDERIQRDYQMCVALQKPALALLATLANACASVQTGNFERGIRFARSHCAEFSEMLDTALEVGSMEEVRFGKMREQVNEIQSMLASLASVWEGQILGNI